MSPKEPIRFQSLDDIATGEFKYLFFFINGN